MEEKPKRDTIRDADDNWFCDSVEKLTVEDAGLDGRKRSSGKQLERGGDDDWKNNGVGAESEEVRYA